MSTQLTEAIRLIQASLNPATQIVSRLNDAYIKAYLDSAGCAFDELLADDFVVTS
jgi:hypothetical protein